MSRVSLVFFGVAAVLSLEVDLVLFYIRVKHIVGTHPKYLCEADEEVK